ncbi:hypothetical protein BN1048_00309 [Jeotgalicoccus saudimassiliensis]|uniref:DUF2929 family protein n=1 Tax=Jeotgalicoccus saudimassiliensis TaxID=1461582 RepID=A0A078LYS6_9STAP|nr:YjzD family protein [Jeotgalicoccus saudimassiliensis]CDZ99184.1 hypothetical protein BN1048_00309 [Jeotgalicoccus saudimassiliensis]
MRYLVTFFWAFLLTQMVNFILNSLAGGGPINFWIGVVLAVAITLAIFILDGLTKMSADHTHAGDEH